MACGWLAFHELLAWNEHIQFDSQFCHSHQHNYGHNVNWCTLRLIFYYIMTWGTPFLNFKFMFCFAICTRRPVVWEILSKNDILIKQNCLKSTKNRLTPSSIFVEKNCRKFITHFDRHSHFKNTFADTITLM